jgi:hypothetical protein
VAASNVEGQAASSPTGSSSLSLNSNSYTNVNGYASNDPPPPMASGGVSASADGGVQASGDISSGSVIFYENVVPSSGNVELSESI